MTSVSLLKLVPAVIDMKSGLPSISYFGLETDPVHSVGSPSLLRPRLTQTSWSGAGLSNLLSIAYDYNVLGLGPDSPWDD
jgi:hypothetical protein